MLAASVGERAVSLFGQGHNCAQAVLMAVAEQHDLQVSPAVASAFGGGMARTGQTCGAVTGALMALGLGYGERPGEGDPRESVSDVGRQLMDDFAERFGSTDCEELIKGRFAIATTPPTYCVDTKKELCRELVRCAAEAAHQSLGMLGPLV